MDGLKRVGVDLNDVTRLLEEQGVAAFEKSWEELIESVTAKLTDHGAEVMPAGAVKPAKSGASAGAPQESAR
jgi:transaldolase